MLKNNTPSRKLNALGMTRFMARLMMRSLFYLFSSLLVTVSYDIYTQTESAGIDSQPTSERKRKKIAFEKTVQATETVDSSITAQLIDGRSKIYILHESSLDSKTSFIEHDVAEAILSNGEKLIILRDHYSSSPSTSRLMRIFPSQVFTIDSPLPLTRWVQNYLGTIVKDSYGHKLVGFDIAQTDRPGDNYASQFVAAALRIEASILPIKMHGSSFVRIGTSTAAISRKVMYDNPHLSLSQINRYLHQLGIANPIWTPWLPGEPGGHLDLCVGVAGDSIFVPSVHRANPSNKTNGCVDETIQIALDRIALILNANGFAVNRLLMPPVSDPDSQTIKPYYSPVNWIYLENASTGGASNGDVLIPIAELSEYDQRVIDECNTYNQRILKEHGIQARFIRTALPSIGGGLHCVVARLSVVSYADDRKLINQNDETKMLLI